MNDVYAGWSYLDSPTIIWATDSYGGGGVNNVPKTVNDSAVMHNKYYNLTSTYNREMYGYYFGGLLLGSNWYKYTTFAERVVPMANATNGYWVWQSIELTEKCERLIGNNETHIAYEARLPTNCENDLRNPGCCLNNRYLNDSDWLSQCCPHYDESVNKMWRALNTTNHRLDIMEMLNGSLPECFDGIDNDLNGQIDFPDDPGCASELDESEFTPCVDNDGDGYGVCPACGLNHGCTFSGDDCDDFNLNRNPGMREILNAIDDDCNGFIDLLDQNLFLNSCFGDLNRNGYVGFDDIGPMEGYNGSGTCGFYGDPASDWCNFTDIDRNGVLNSVDTELFIFMLGHPGACNCSIGPELVDGYDNDCDGLIDEDSYCGDRNCGIGESCSSCSLDCGECSAECDDGIDNDIDNKTDLEDPGCINRGDNSEYSDPDSWWKMKGIFSFENSPGNQQEFMANLTLAARYGFNVLQSYDGIDHFLPYMNRSSQSGSLMRKYKMKVMVPLGGMGGVLENSINSTTTNISFVVRNISEYTLNIMNGDYYSNSTNRTIWIDGECIKFDNYTKSYFNKPGYRYTIVRATLNGVVRGYCTPAMNHTSGTYEINKWIIDYRIHQYMSEDFSDVIWGYWAMDDAAMDSDAGWLSNFSYAEQVGKEIIRSVDPDLSRPIVWGWGINYGISDYVNIEGVGLYVYPWTGSTYGYINNTQQILDQYEYIRNHSNSTVIFPVAQTYGSGFSTRLPTEDELSKEIVLHKSLGADSIFFYAWSDILNNTNSFENSQTTENWKRVLLGIPLGSLTPSFTTQIIGDKKVRFNASSSRPGHGPILNYTWNFGDGTIVSTGDEYVDHQYSSEGTFSVSLNISNYVVGESAEIRKDILDYSLPENEEGSGGSGGGGSGLIRPPNNPPGCTPNWQCSWGACESNLQRQICSDLNNCNSTENEPVEETRACGSENENDGTIVGEEGDAGLIGNREYSIIWIVSGFGMIFLAIIGSVIYIASRDKNKKLFWGGLTFVDEARRRGYSDEEIKKMFLAKGWDEDEIDRFIKP